MRGSQSGAFPVFQELSNSGSPPAKPGDYSGEFIDTLNMYNLSSETIFMRDGAQFEKSVDLTFAKINDMLDISGAIFSSLDLTGTEVIGGFNLGSEKHPPARWRPGAKLTLNNTKVGILQDLDNSWPNELYVEGFSYSQLGGLYNATGISMAKRNVKWLKSWLEKHNNYSPQIYEQLGKTLKTAGYKAKAKAKEILYTGKERQREEARIKKEWTNWLKLTILNLFIGYGYKIQYLLAWVLLLTSAGALILQFSSQGLDYNMPFGISYSFGALLPFIKLEEWYSTIILTGFPKYYFYFQKVMGYVIVSMLIAGVTGITKK